MNKILDFLDYLGGIIVAVFGFMLYVFIVIAPFYIIYHFVSKYW
jgi:hypothetical protein